MRSELSIAFVSGLVWVGFKTKSYMGSLVSISKAFGFIISWFENGNPKIHQLHITPLHRHHFFLFNGLTLCVLQLATLIPSISSFPNCIRRVRALRIFLKIYFFYFCRFFGGWKTILGLKITGWFCLRAGWLKDRFLFSLNNVIVFVLIYSFLTAGWQCRQMIDGAGRWPVQIPTSGWLIVLEFKL